MKFSSQCKDGCDTCKTAEWLDTRSSALKRIMHFKLTGCSSEVWDDGCKRYDE